MSKEPFYILERLDERCLDDAQRRLGLSPRAAGHLVRGKLEVGKGNIVSTPSVIVIHTEMRGECGMLVD